MTDNFIDGYEGDVHTRYLETVPSPRTVTEAILGSLRASFSVKLLHGEASEGRLKLTADGIRLTLTVVPEARTASTPGEFTWNGRWNVVLSPQRGDDLKMRVLNENISEGIARIEAHIRERLEIERQFEQHAGLRLVVSNR